MPPTLVDSSTLAPRVELRGRAPWLSVLLAGAVLSVPLFASAAGASASGTAADAAPEFPTPSSVAAVSSALTGARVSASRPADSLTSFDRDRPGSSCSATTQSTRSSATTRYVVEDAPGNLGRVVVALTVHEFATSRKARSSLRSLRAGVSACSADTVSTRAGVRELIEFSLEGALPGTPVAYRLGAAPTVGTSSQDVAVVLLRSGRTVLQASATAEAEDAAYVEQLAGATGALLVEQLG